MEKQRYEADRRDECMRTLEGIASLLHCRTYHHYPSTMRHYASRQHTTTEQNQGNDPVVKVDVEAIFDAVESGIDDQRIIAVLRRGTFS